MHIVRLLTCQTKLKLNTCRTHSVKPIFVFAGVVAITFTMITFVEV